MKIALDARLPMNQWGGVQQTIQGIARGLSTLDGSDEFVFITDGAGREWLDPDLSGPCRRVEWGADRGRSVARRAYDAGAGRWPKLMRRMGAFVPRSIAAGAVPRSDGRLERLGVDLVHFLTPQAFLTDVASIYQPHDLLHVHVPSSFSPIHREYRQRAYEAFARQARFVVAMTAWGRRDIAEHLSVPPDRIAVVPWAPVSSAASPDRVAAAEIAGHPSGRSLLYPAQTWPHKNHLRLIEAVAVVRAEGHDVTLICPGRLTDHAGDVVARARELGIDEHVRFPGLVRPEVLAGLYDLASAMVFPSMFEGWGLPVVEAFERDLPVAASNAAAIPDVAAGAALLFDGSDVGAIAAAIRRITSDEPLRAELRAAGRARVAKLAWTTTAHTFRALYRRALGEALDAGDLDLLAPPTLVPA